MRFVDLSGLKNVKQIGYGFLWGNRSVIRVDLSPLANVTTIGHSFLRYCSSLTEVDLTPLVNVTSIETYDDAETRLLSNCPELVKVKVLKKSAAILEEFNGREQLLERCDVPTGDVAAAAPAKPKADEDEAGGKLKA
jgi:hypothetical protein